MSLATTGPAGARSIPTALGTARTVRYGHWLSLTMTSTLEPTTIRAGGRSGVMTARLHPTGSWWRPRVSVWARIIWTSGSFFPMTASSSEGPRTPPAAARFGRRPTGLTGSRSTPTSPSICTTLTLPGAWRRRVEISTPGRATPSAPAATIRAPRSGSTTEVSGPGPR